MSPSPSDTITCPDIRFRSLTVLHLTTFTTTSSGQLILFDINPTSYVTTTSPSLLYTFGPNRRSTLLTRTTSAVRIDTIFL